MEVQGNWVVMDGLGVDADFLLVVGEGFMIARETVYAFCQG